jgi:hypothetical protein
MRLKNIIIICIAVAAFSAAQAEVFTLWPKGKSKGQELDTFLKSTALISEPVRINGAKAELKLSLVRINFYEILNLLKNKFPTAKFAAGGDSILVKQKLTNGWHKRLLLVYFGEFFPILQISITLPPKLPRPDRWPRTLTMTSDGIPLRYMYFPKRESWYGMFKTSMDPAQALAEVASSVTAQGWAPITGESSSRYQGRGEIFLKKKPLSIMLINFSESGVATVFARRMK